jgi:1-aminocyclopropane-1-carboxylate deaminase/D-cysteine desulfhydrase-like pyridoxal-dependent ACC family enzyme
MGLTMGSLASPSSREFNQIEASGSRNRILFLHLGLLCGLFRYHARF